MITYQGGEYIAPPPPRRHVLAHLAWFALGALAFGFIQALTIVALSVRL